MGAVLSSMPKSLIGADGREHTSLAVAKSQGVRAHGGTCGAMPKGVCGVVMRTYAMYGSMRFGAKGNERR